MFCDREHSPLLNKMTSGLRSGCTVWLVCLLNRVSDLAVRVQEIALTDGRDFFETRHR
jgi:hypothetical protein